MQLYIPFSTGSTQVVILPLFHSSKMLSGSWKYSRSRHIRISDAPTLDSKQSCSLSSLELSPLLALQHLHNTLTYSHPLPLKGKSWTLARLCHFQASIGAGWGDNTASHWHPERLLLSLPQFPSPFHQLLWQQEAAKLQFPLDYCSVKWCWTKDTKIATENLSYRSVCQQKGEGSGHNMPESVNYRAT